MANEAEWLIGAGQGRRDVRVLFTSAGRRIELIQSFFRAARSLGLKGIFHAADVEPYFAAACVTQYAHRVPPSHSSEYVPSLLRLARRHRIDLVIPLIDSELLPLTNAADQFARFKCGVVVSSPEVVRTCRDKLKMFEFLARHQIDTPQTWTLAEIRRIRRYQFPYFAKPRFGSASKGNFIVRNRHDWAALTPLVPDGLVQEFVPGVEHTLDVYTGYRGEPCCVVPRRRIEVRGGEVTKAQTVKHEGIMETGMRVARTLGGCVGLITIQLILTPEERIRVIEVNPRFGGGAPLGIWAGADSPRWLLSEWLGRKPRIRLDNFQEGLMMLRYHQSFFIHVADSDQTNSARKPKQGRFHR